MTTEQEDDDRMKRLSKAADLLAEHFSSVQIIATYEEGETTPYHSGRGNWYARYGSVIEWVMLSEDQMRNSFEGEGDDEED